MYDESATARLVSTCRPSRYHPSMESLATAIDLFHRGQIAEAEAACERMLAQTPDRCDALTLLAELRSSSGRMGAAIDAWRALAVLQPQDAANLRRLGSALLSVGERAEAVDVQRRAVAIEPGNVRGHNNLGQALLQLGRLPEAVECFERTLQIEPGYAIGRLNLATALERMEQPALALTHYDRLVASCPANAEAWARRGAFLSRLNRATEALQSFEQGLQLRPHDADTLNRKAAALLSLERPTEALSAAEHALAHQTSAVALHVKAAALCRLHRPAEALPCIERVIELAPDDVEAWCHRAIVHEQLEDRAAATRCYRHALDLDPSCVGARTGLIAGLIPAVPMSVAESLEARAEFDRELAAFELWLKGRELGVDDAWTVARQPFFYLSYQEASNRTLLQRYRQAGAARLRRLTGLLPPSPSGERAPQARFRLGIVSAHAYDHSVFNAIVRGWLERIDRARFETSLFSLGLKRDAATDMAERGVDCFEAQPRTLPEWAELIRKRELDALIFPEVGIDRNSLALASLRLARRQFAAWGHPETTGLPTIDAFLSADAFEPADAEEHYSEQLVRLPNLGVYYPRDAVEPEPVDLVSLGIPTDRPLLVCPGAPFKYRPEDDSVLVEIALRLKSCTFVFFTHERQALSSMLRARLSAAFAAAGLRPDRLLVWIPWQPRRAFLGILEQADVYLDTIGFSGFNTLMQAIEVHLPCVAYEGRFLRGRLGSGILRRLELAELVASNNATYVDIAVRLAADRAYRAEVKDRQRAAAHRAYADQGAVEALERLLLA
jgi:protein O-GlcNAc transferase